MATCSIKDLQASACENKFTCLDPKVSQAVLLQLLCNIQQAGGTGGATNFTDLGDVPGSYAGSGGFTVRVNAAGNALEFVNVAATAQSVFSGNYAGGTPTDVPTVGTATGFDTSNSTTWLWYGAAWHRQQYISANVAIVSATHIHFTHGLGAKPKDVRAVLVCVNDDTNMECVVGDEVNVESVFDTNLFGPAVTVSADVTAVTLSYSQDLFGREGNFMFNSLIMGGPSNPLDWANFKLKVYASL